MRTSWAFSREILTNVRENGILILWALGPAVKNTGRKKE